MQAPANPDDKIKQLLLSEIPADQIAGLELLDKTYRLEIPGYIRSWNKESLVTLHSHDLADIWQATLSSVDRNVQQGKFKLEGSLAAYLRTIARRRAIDLIRSILRIRPTDYLDDLPSQSSDENSWILEEINKLVCKLPENDRDVNETDIALFFVNNSKWPSLEELTDEYNRLYPDNPLTVSAVKGRRFRGQKTSRTPGRFR